MSDNFDSSTTARARLHEVASKLRQGPLDEESQRALAALIDELTNTLETQIVPSPEVARLVQSTTHLAESLHVQDRGLLGKARDGIEWALIDAEAHAPVAVGLARKLLDTLSNFGI
jgi:hypothetical protein